MFLAHKEFSQGFRFQKYKTNVRNYFNIIRNFLGVDFFNFLKVDRCFRKYDKARYPALFHSNKKYNRSFDRIRYLLVLKSNTSDVYSNKYTKIKINSDDN